MRVIHLSAGTPGGGKQYALRLSDSLNRIGIESTVLVTENPEVHDQAEVLKETSNALDVFCNRASRFLINRKARGSYHSIRRWNTYSTRSPICSGDIIHMHGMTGWIGLRGMRRLFPMNARVFWTAHDLWMVSGGCVVYDNCDKFTNECRGCPILPSYMQRMPVRELKLKEAFVKKHSIHPIANSQWMRNKIKVSRVFGGHESIPVIPPIIKEEFLSKGDRSYRQRLGISQEELVVSLGARSITDPYKGIGDFLREAVRHPELKNVSFLVFGDGQLERIPGLNIHFLGRVSSAHELSGIYAASDLFLSPSLMETFGMSIAEAQAQGIPVCGFNTGGVPEAIYPEWRSLLIEELDFSLLCRTLIQAIASLDTYRIHSERAANWIQDNFSGKRVAEKQLAAYSFNNTTPDLI